MSTLQPNESIHKKLEVYTIVALTFLLLTRIVSMWFIPLNDTTEARYGEIARKMLETGNWVTLQHDYGVPFWAKPPLSTWLSALSMKFFGVNEFAVRLPGLLLSIGVLGLIWHLARKYSDPIVAKITLLVLAGALYFYLDAGTVMTDPSLLFCTTLSMVAFWFALDGHKLWSWIFFAGLGLGLLAKGPIAVVLVAVPLFFWVLFRNEWLRLWKNFPWIKGSLLTLAIALPWYLLAEWRTPGFLNYFIIGEHLNRFLTPGWTGDKYGMAHDEPWGMIWVFAIAGIFPWSILGSTWLVRHWKKVPSYFQDKNGWMSYLLLFTICPLIFFTFASNIIYTYVFPTLPAFALLFAELWNRSKISLKNLRWIFISSLSCGIIFVLVTVLFQIKPELVAKTQKPIVSAWIHEQPSAGSSLIYWDYKTDYSAQFYSSGKVKFAENLESLQPLLSRVVENYLAIKENKLKEFPSHFLSQCTSVKSAVFKSDKTILFQCPSFKGFS